MRTFLAFILTIFLLQGCTYRSWHAGFVAGQKFQCNKLTGQDRQDCMELIEDNFDRYQREREEALNRTE